MGIENMNVFLHNGTKHNTSLYNNTVGFNGTSSRPTISAGRGGIGSEQFVESAGFILAYLLLIFCCVVPSCIVFRRRNQMYYHNQYEDRHPYLQQLSDYGLIMMQQEHRNQEAEDNDRNRRARRLQQALEATTMVLRVEDVIETRHDNDDVNNGPDLEMLVLDDSEQHQQHHILIQLGQDLANGNRQISSTCAICLCPYELGEELSVSPNQLCVHGFHTECIITWLSKSNETKCPCCRQEFCMFDNDEEAQQQQQHIPTRESSTEEDAEGSDFFDDAESLSFDT